jgi:pimeloyl-ACP methyl ester carboxylesterase
MLMATSYRRCFFLLFGYKRKYLLGIGEENMDSQIAQTKKGLVEYTMRGEGPTVLVCHGVSSNCFSTEVAKPLNNAGFSVLTPSRPGYGRTPASVDKTASDASMSIVALMDVLGIQSCSVIAISGGGPTGLVLASHNPQRVNRLILLEAISWTENRQNDSDYKDQMAFYGPMHNVMWGMLGLMSRVSPRSMARQTLTLFSTHDVEDGLSRLSPSDIDKICRFYRGHSSRQGALIDATHTVGVDVLHEISQPTLVIHSREDKSVPFSHAEWSLKNIHGAELYESGFTGHFYWGGPDFQGVIRRMVSFLKG